MRLRQLRWERFDSVSFDPQEESAMPLQDRNVGSKTPEEIAAARAELESKSTEALFAATLEGGIRRRGCLGSCNRFATPGNEGSISNGKALLRL